MLLKEAKRDAEGTDRSTVISTGSARAIPVHIGVTNMGTGDGCDLKNMRADYAYAIVVRHSVCRAHPA